MDDQSNSVFHKINADWNKKEYGIDLSRLSAPANCIVQRKRCNCEEIRQDDFPLQPYSAYSSLFIFLYGLIRFIKYFRSKKIQNRFWDLLLISIGMGSFFFHAKLQYWAEIWDFSAIYWVGSAGSVFFYNQATFFRTGRYRFGSAFGIILSAGIAHFWIALMLLFPFLRAILAGVVMVGSIVFISSLRSAFPKSWIKELKISFISLIFGGICFVLDFFDPLCSPSSWFQLHVVWHLAMTFALIRLTRLIGAEES